MSKRIIRVLSMVLTLVMMLSLSTPAFAWGGIDTGKGWDRQIDEDDFREIEPAEEVEEEEVYDYFQTDGSDGYQVTVEAPMGSLPMQAELHAEPVEIEEVREAVESVVEGEANILVALDISFWMNGIEIEPEDAVRVKISAPELLDKTNLSVVHIPDGEEPEKVNLVDEEGLSFALGANEVAFEANSFSVYAVLEEGETGDNARLFVTFKQANGGTDIEIPVKKTDIGENFDMVLYDPGVGTLTGKQTFMGWTTDENYTTETEGLTIDDVRTAVTAMLNAGVKEGDKLTYYPMLFDAYSVTYLDEDGAVITSVPVLVKSGTSVEYTIDQYYDPKYPDSRFEGWGVAQKNEAGKWVLPAESSMTKYNNGDTVNFGTGDGALTDDLVLKAFVPAGYWLIYKENGQGASFTPPDFYRGVPTEEPTAPTRFGYTFGGWYLDEDCTQPFTFGSVLTATTRVYAKWDPATRANYTVIIWTQNLDASGYDFKEVVTVENATVGQNTNVQMQGTGNNAYARINGNINKQYEGFHLKEQPTNVEVTPEGTAVVQVYYDRTAYTFTFVSGNTTIHTVTRLYDQDITDIWAFTGSDGRTYPRTDVNTSWTPLNSSTYTARITALQRMPAEDITWRHTTSNNTTRYFHYYVEVPDGETGTRTFQGRQFKLYKDLPNDFNVVYYNDDFWVLKGFDRLAMAKSNNNVVNVGAGRGIGWDSTNYTNAVNYTLNGNNGGGGDRNHLYFYYTRQQYPINYMDGKYVDGNGVEIDETNRGQLHESAKIDFEADISSYGKDGSNYYDPKFDGYTFAGWFADKACTIEYNFVTMPMDGITVYAKWIRNQYRVFLYPNATDKNKTGEGTNDPTFESGEQETCFRIDEGEEINNIKATREEYILSGWFTDPELKNAFNFDSFSADKNHVTTPYDRSESTERNYYGDVTQNTNKDATNNRFWINYKIELYAKWRYKLIGADGITVVYESGDEGKFADGSTSFTDPLRYQDSADAVAQAASKANEEGKEFKCWVLQTWNGSDFVPTETKVLPGDTFTIDIANAQRTENDDHTDENPSYTYTIKLIAEYGDIEAPTPTHINWYSNVRDIAGLELDVNKFTKSADAEAEATANGWVVIREPIEINKAYNIEPADTYGYEGYTFLGWAKKADATEKDLFLKYVDGKFYAQKVEGTGDWDMEVTQVAADENLPYDDLYAVWQGVFYVYHSGVEGGNIETITIDKTTFDLTNTPEGLTDGTLYGGYYLKGGFTAPDATDGVPSATCAAYDGTNWTWTTPVRTEAGNAITPVAGTTYYIKEVPADKYLQPYLHYTYKWNDGTITASWLVSNVDDTKYKETGFLVISTAEDKAKVCNSLTVQNTGTQQNTVKLTTDLVFNVTGGYLTYLPVMDANGAIASTGYAANCTIKQYWITPDGLAVTSANARTYGVIDSHYTINKSAVDLETDTAKSNIYTLADWQKSVPAC